MTDFLDDKRSEITDRLKELQPLVEEYHRLESAARALDGIPHATSSEASAASTSALRRRGPGRPRGAKSQTSQDTAATPAPHAATRKPVTRAGKRSKAGRRKGAGKRAIEALAHIMDSPGIQIPEIAAKMGIKQNYLYRVLPGLEQDGKVEKQGRGWHPKTSG